MMALDDKSWGSHWGHFWQMFVARFTLCEAHRRTTVGATRGTMSTFDPEKGDKSDLRGDYVQVTPGWDIKWTATTWQITARQYLLKPKPWKWGFLSCFTPVHCRLRWIQCPILFSCFIHWPADNPAAMSSSGVNVLIPICLSISPSLCGYVYLSSLVVNPWLRINRKPCVGSSWTMPAPPSSLTGPLLSFKAPLTISENTIVQWAAICFWSNDLTIRLPTHPNIIGCSCGALVITTL